jgi:FtsP/CotA-like multicopper oxidase with cupredoxin domain
MIANSSLLIIIVLTTTISVTSIVVPLVFAVVKAQLATTTTTTTTELTDEEIQAQIQKLLQLLKQKHLADITAPVTPTDLLATKNGLVFPSISSANYDKLKNCNPDQAEPAINSSEFQNRWKSYLTDFKCGHVVKRFANNNTALREFTLIAHDNQGYGNYVNVSKNATDPIVFPAWLFNNSMPGPTMRMTQGDHVRITVINSNDSKFAHSFHMHSIHSGLADGMSGKGGMIMPGQNFTFEFISRPYGVYPYHCHMSPIQFHISRGLYGMMIIDPPQPRPAAKEMVMLMNGYSYNQGIDLVHPNNTAPPTFTIPSAQDLREATNKQAIDAWKSDDKQQQQPTSASNRSIGKGDDPNGNNTAADEEELAKNTRIQQTLSPGPQVDNQIYTVNGKAFAYTDKDMIPLVINRNYRIYLVNILEFDQVNSFHMHGNMFGYIPSGTSTNPSYVNDILTLGQGDRGILEFKYLVPGDFMIHSHVNRFAELGWTGFFHVSKQ